MKVQYLTCIECPIGCEMEVGVEENKAVYVKGNTCPRGKMYAENEVVCPRRVVTSTVRAQNGTMIPVKTDKPVRKSDIFAIMQKINQATCSLPIRIGDIVIEHVSEDANVVATGNIDK